jgi:hypothetical protein
MNDEKLHRIPELNTALCPEYKTIHRISLGKESEGGCGGERGLPEFLEPCRRGGKEVGQGRKLYSAWKSARMFGISIRTQNHPIASIGGRKFLRGRKRFGEGREPSQLKPPEIVESPLLILGGGETPPDQILVGTMAQRGEGGVLPGSAKNPVFKRFAGKKGGGHGSHTTA